MFRTESPPTSFARFSFSKLHAVLDCLRSHFVSRDCRCVELRAPCDEVPRTPPGPEGSNGTGIASCAAEYPKFLSSISELRSIVSYEREFSVALRIFQCPLC